MRTWLTDSHHGMFAWQYDHLSLHLLATIKSTSANTWKLFTPILCYVFAVSPALLRAVNAGTGAITDWQLPLRLVEQNKWVFGPGAPLGRSRQPQTAAWQRRFKTANRAQALQAGFQHVMDLLPQMWQSMVIGGGTFDVLQFLVEECGLVPMIAYVVARVYALLYPKLVPVSTMDYMGWGTWATIAWILGDDWAEIQKQSDGQLEKRAGRQGKALFDEITALAPLTFWHSYLGQYFVWDITVLEHVLCMYRMFVNSTQRKYKPRTTDQDYFEMLSKVF